MYDWTQAEEKLKVDNKNEIKVSKKDNEQAERAENMKSNVKSGCVSSKVSLHQNKENKVNELLVKRWEEKDVILMFISQNLLLLNVSI